MASSFRTHILAQLRNGKRSWFCAEMSGDFGAFRAQVVEPLRRLKYDGVIQALSEDEAPLNGTTRVIAVHIIGAVDLSFAKDNDSDTPES